MVSLSLTGADTYWFVCMHFVIIMGVSYEAERHYRFLFLNMRAATKMGIDNARLVEKNLTLSLALAEQRVEDKQRELDSKRTIVRQISHEIRTPLNVVAVGLDLVRRQLLQRFSTSLSPPPAAAAATLVAAGGDSDGIACMLETLSNCEEGCSCALEVISDFLAFEKLSAGMYTLEKVTSRSDPLALVLRRRPLLAHTTHCHFVIVIVVPRHRRSWCHTFKNPSSCSAPRRTASRCPSPSRAAAIPWPSATPSTGCCWRRTGRWTAPYRPCAATSTR